ncbi:nucleoside-diphosphate-sugar epimerase [Bradyrhizobium sp. USDA 4529]
MLQTGLKTARFSCSLGLIMAAPDSKRRVALISGTSGQDLVDLLIGGASKARAKLGWAPKTPFAQLVKEMVASDRVKARQDAANGKHGV